MSDEWKNWENPDAMRATVKVAGACRYLMVDQLESGDKLRVETDPHWYEFDMIQPELGLSIVRTDDPKVENGTHCFIHGALMSPFSRMIMAGRVSSGLGIALGCVRTDDIDPEYATGMVEKVLVNGEEVVFAKDPN